MPKYRNPRTGEEVEDPSGGLKEFYLGHQWELADGEEELQPPSDMNKLLSDISSEEPKKKGK